jgi:Na+/proline symporter
VDLSYKYHFFDGAVLPIGLGLSLILNGVFLARHMNKAGALTLPDIYASRYGSFVEIIASLITILSFLVLLAGNLVGMSVIISFLLGVSLTAAVFVSAAIILVYTACGGLMSVAYTDVVQSTVGISGCLVLAAYFISTTDVSAPPVSIGFPKPADAPGSAGMYIYPDTFGEGGACDLYEGVPCTNNPDACCYNTDKWCPADGTDCFADNGAYPFGDKRVFSNQLSSPAALTPFPNAIFWDWATIFILGFGNLAALDFQARCFAAQSPKVATMACIFAGIITFCVGVPLSYLGAITRVHYGPDSIHAEFVADTCSKILDLPQCAMWKPDVNAFLNLLTHEAPGWLGGWCLIGIVAASMSTCDGAILAIATVSSHNLWRKVKDDPSKLLTVTRIATVPTTIIAALIAAFYQSGHPAGATGYLLIIAFDIVLAGCIVPLFAAFYVSKPSPNAALAAIVGGSLLRVILELTLPKDGYLILPWAGDEFLDYGSVSSDLYPNFFDVSPADKWDPSSCVQRRLADYTGVDSLVSPLFSLILFATVHMLEKGGRNVFPCIPLRLMTPRPIQTIDFHATAIEMPEKKLDL